MSKAARSVWAFGIYLAVLGIVLLVAPNVLLVLFTMPPTNEVWIRVVGMLVLIVGIYYYLAARNEMTQFLRWTVYLRASVIFFFVAFVLLGLTNPPLILFGVFDLLGAIWTWYTLRPSEMLAARR